jgi:Flp pilus assembly protein TadG
MFVRIRKFVQGSEGTVMVMMALGLVAFLGLASLAVDMGNLYVAKNELQNVADAAALAGARQLVDNSSGTAVVDSAAAQAAAMGVAQTQAQLSGLASLPDGSRTDLSIAFGNWNIYAGNPSTAWTTTDGSAGSNSNAVQVTIQRASGLAYGPVTNFLAGILGYNTTNVAATATAYLGFANTTTTGAVDLPIAVPSTLVTAFYPQPKSW